MLPCCQETSYKVEEIFGFFSEILLKNGKKQRWLLHLQEYHHKNWHKGVASEGRQDRGDLIHKYNEVNVIRLIIHRRLGFFLLGSVCGLRGEMGRYRTAVKERVHCVVSLCSNNLARGLASGLSFLAVYNHQAWSPLSKDPKIEMPCNRFGSETLKLWFVRFWIVRKCNQECELL